MRVFTEAAAMAAELDRVRGGGRTVALVPTMGALHAGHASLIRRAAIDGGAVMVSVFVNPLQFGPSEDLDAYPRRLQADAATAAEAGASYVFAPSPDEMYPAGFHTRVHIGGITERLEGAARPGHFDGVTTVVAKLFAITGRSRAYFGEKDFQQLQVVRQLARDLSLPVDVVGCPTVREPDGLALSSRNAYLNDKERAMAPVLNRALRLAAAMIRTGERDLTILQAAMADEVSTKPLVDLEYAEVVDAATLRPSSGPPASLRLLIAGRIGTTRLIDNIPV